MNERSPRVIGFVFARGGSKGVKGKNIKLLAGKPLIVHAIEKGIACSRIERIIVSTDSPEIADVARRYGAETPFARPAELATDTASEWLAWQHAIRWFIENNGMFDIFVSLPATSPLRSVKDVDACIDVLLGDAMADIVITVTRAARSPYFNMVRLDAEGFAQIVIEGSERSTRRQDVPPVYDMTTVAYVARPSFVLSASAIFDGRVRVVEVPQERSIDIDTPYDFMLAECLARSSKRDDNI
jgi:N-acylneuraminate cytidylyltransferase